MSSSPTTPAKTSSGSTRGAAWSLVRWILMTLVIAAAGLAACLPSLLGTPERVTRLVATAVPELAADVRPGTVRLGWFGPIVLEDLAVVPRTVSDMLWFVAPGRFSSDRESKYVPVNDPVIIVAIDVP